MVRSLLNDVNIYGGVWYNILIRNETKQKVFWKKAFCFNFYVFQTVPDDANGHYGTPCLKA